jgi:hypothetical protein
MDPRSQLSLSLGYSVRRLPEFTSIKITGAASLESFAELIKALGEETRVKGDRRVLVDLLSVTGELRFTEHFQMGEQAARQLQHLDKLASLVPKDKITHTSEKVALMQGLQLRVFTSMTEAIRWLGHEA